MSPAALHSSLRRLSYYVFASLVTQLVIIPILSAQLQMELPTGLPNGAATRARLRTLAPMTDEIGLGMN